MNEVFLVAGEDLPGAVLIDNVLLPGKCACDFVALRA